MPHVGPSPSRGPHSSTTQQCTRATRRAGAAAPSEETTGARLAAVRPVVLAAARVVIGFLFACHGVKTVFGVLGAHAAASPGAWPSWWAGLIQLVCGSLLALGLGTRAAALLASGSMAFAYFTVHAADGFFPIANGGEQAALYCWVLLLFVVIGSGPYALDRALAHRRAPGLHRTGAGRRVPAEPEHPLRLPTAVAGPRHAAPMP